MESLQVLKMAAAAAVIGGSLFAAATPAAAVPAHSGIQPAWATRELLSGCSRLPWRL